MDRLGMVLLFDYYASLLSEKQRACFDLYYNCDLSLSEIAEQLGISRQGAWDNVRRAEESLDAFEKEIGLVRRAAEIKSSLLALREEISVASPSVLPHLDSIIASL